MTSVSATERVKLWTQFSTCSDHETIKTDFIRRVHRKNPPFRFKLKPKPRHCAEIPPMVEFHYKNPPPLLPSLKDVLRCERVYRERGLPNVVETPHTYDEVDQDLEEIQIANEKVRLFEEELCNENDITMDECSIEETDTNGSIEKKELTEMEVIENIVENIPMIDDEKIIEKIEIRPPQMPDTTEQTIAENGVNNEHDENNVSEIDNANPTQESSINDLNKMKSNRKRKRHTSSKGFGTECDDLLELSEEVFKSKLMNGTNGTISPTAIDDQLDGLDVDVIKRLALAQLQLILKECPELVTKYQHENANKAIKDALKAKPVKMTLPSQLLSKDDIAKIAEQFANKPTSDENDGSDPAYAGVKHPITPMPDTNTDTFYYATGFEHIMDDNERALAIAQRLKKPIQESKVRARAVLTPVGDILAGKQWYTNTHLDDSIFIRYRSLKIGSGSDCDLQVKNIRKCARLSSHHATIFYDEVSHFRKQRHFNCHVF